jgi:transcriptional regulator with XRE-family HTH domain
MVRAKGAQIANERIRTMTKRHGQPNLRLEEARRAVGALLGFYRRIRSLSQEDLAKETNKALSGSVSATTVAMAESGYRLPSLDAVAAMANALQLDRFQKRQLEALVEYPKRATKPDDEWFLPNDVLAGIPMFLRTLTKESQFQLEAAISEMWIVTERPLAFDGEMRQLLKKRLIQDKTAFVYFIDFSIGEAPFRALWDGLCKESPRQRKAITERLRCVLTPPAFCLQHFAICNPGSKTEDMFGRAILYSGGAAVGFMPMDRAYVTRAYRL